jgi:DNA modification methylase
MKTSNVDPKGTNRAQTPEWLLLQGDALRGSRCFREGAFDLIYADPPFFTGRVRRGNAAGDFDDRWGKDLDGYLAWLMPRLTRMHALLAPTGSLFVHLDWHAAHAVKVELDRIFGRDLFINEIIWSYRTGGTSGRWLARKHDTLLFYARSPAYKFHAVKEKSRLSHKYGFSNVEILTDERGPYRWALMRDVWELPALRGNMPERVDFPTQKPLALLRRIVSLVTDPGDLVGDFFCGSGTTLVAAVKENRRAVGMDISAEALGIASKRLDAVIRCGEHGFGSAAVGQNELDLTTDSPT